MNSRLERSFSSLVQSCQPVDYLALYECEILEQAEDGTVSARATDRRLPSGGLSSIPIRYGIPGVEARVPRGTRCVVAFEAGDPSRPYVKDFLWSASGSVELHIKSQQRVIVESPLVELAGNSHPITKADVNANLLTGILNLLKTMAPIGNLGIPVLFGTDVTGANSFGAGGVTAVSAAMAPGIQDSKSEKVFTG